MSTTKLFKAGMIATVGVAGLTLAANAQSRYGNVYDYESGRNCGQACAPAPTPAISSRYGAPVVAAPSYNPAPVYVDCVQAGTCAPQPSVVYTQPAQPAAPVYTQPAQVYTAPTQTFTQSAQVQSVSCPAGTTSQPDGTCLQSGSSSFSSSTTYSEPSYSSSTTSSTYSAPTTSFEPVSCPSGTTAQADGTCLQSGSSSFSTGTTYSEPSYSSGTTFSSSSSLGPVNCPAGTTAQADGTCMQGGSNAYAGSSIELYTGDAASTTPSTGYGSSNTYSSPDYLPIRK